MKNITYLISAISFAFFSNIQAQCDAVETITICDMTIIDGDGDGTPDGIINLYDQYNAIPGVTPISLATGTWVDPDFNFALNESTGELFLWDLTNVSKSTTDYQFVINSSSCASGVAVRLNLILGPFSGNALPIINADDVNIEICDMGSTPMDGCGNIVDIDLFQALESIPSPHLNGQWIYTGSSPNFNGLLGSNLFVTIPYQSGPPLVDEETFEFIYRVTGIGSCGFTVETRVNVSVVRQVFSGYPKYTRICEAEIVNGNYDTGIDLRDDQFLALEDVEGRWQTDLFGQILSPIDSNVNIKEIYDQIIIRDGARFGCAEVDFTYSVDQRSGVCADVSSTVGFKIYEYLRPFESKGNLVYCADGTQPATINLYSLLEFTRENGVLFDYSRDSWTDWNFISGPSNLGLISNESANPGSPSPGYSSQGTINLSNAAPGNYVFEYLVYPEYNCGNDGFQISNYSPGFCFPEPSVFNPCNVERARVSIVVHPKNYAGEDTTGLEFCENDPLMGSPLNLFALLNTNGVDGPIYQGSLGTWVDNITGNNITNPTAYVLPTINNQQLFNFTYSTTTLNGCVDSADLRFIVFEEYQAGIDTTIDVCNTSPALNLFDELEGSPNTTGTWTGPNGYTTTDQNAIFNPAIAEAGIYTYTVPDNISASGDIVCKGNSATLTVTLHESPNTGQGGLFLVCQSDLEIDLVDYLETGAAIGGSFRDLDNTNLLTGSLLDVSKLVAGRYNFVYEIQGHSSCSLSSTIITISIVEVDPPNAINQTFCITEGATVNDLIATNGVDFNWYDTAISSIPLSLSTVLVDGEDYFVTALDDNGCESPRVSILVTLLPITHADCIDCFKDGISVNNDLENDEFTLCGLPVVFPDFEINIYNRYGTLVYKGNKNTPLFNGNANVPLTIGKGLSSGVYFYVFDPRDGKTKPMQGNFYLSR